MTQPGRDGQERGWDPFTELQSLRAELGRLVGSALVGAGVGRPDVELTEHGEGWVVVARLPGVAPEEVALELDERELCIRGRSEEEVNADYGMPGTGSRGRAFEHRITLPAQADTQRITATMDHGLLTVTVPRAGAGQRRTITIGRLTPGTPDAQDAGSGTLGGARGARGPIPGAATPSPGPLSPAPDETPAGRGETLEGTGGAPRGTYTDGVQPATPADPAADRELHRPDVATGDEPDRWLSG